MALIFPFVLPSVGTQTLMSAARSVPACKVKFRIKSTAGDLRGSVTVAC